MTDLATLQQHQLLTRLLGLSRRQHEALYADQIDDFLSIMDEREQIVGELVTLGEAPPPRNVLPFPSLVPPGMDQDVKAALRGLITSILQQDDENERVLRVQMDELRTTITWISRGAAANRGYASTMSYDADRRGFDRAC
jgi:hypothetical protein